MLMPLTNVLGNFFVIVLAGLGGVAGAAGAGHGRRDRHLYQLRAKLYHPLRQLANMYNTIQSALAGAERVFDLLDTPVEIDAAPAAARTGCAARARRSGRCAL